MKQNYSRLVKITNRLVACKLSTCVASRNKPQLVKGNMDSKPLDVKQKELEDFYMTDPISRASSTMAKCVQAVMKQKQSKYYEAEKA